MSKSVYCQLVIRYLATRSKTVFWSFTAAWIGLVSWGISTLTAFDRTPGASGESITMWPRVSRLRPNPVRPTLLMFVHSQCTCSRASLEALEQIIGRCRGRVDAHVLFYRPASRIGSTSDLWERARALPGVQVSWDEGGVEAGRFGAFTSGDTLLWSPAGELLYRGGLTGSRGQIGDNPGRAAVVELLLSGSAPRNRAPVFGCPVRGRGTAPAAAGVRP